VIFECGIEIYSLVRRTLAPNVISSHVQIGDADKMTTHTLSTNVLRVAATLASVIVAIGYAGPVVANSTEPIFLAQSSDDTMARCQQLFSLWSRHNTDGYAKPLDANMALENCRKGNVASGVAALKRVLERAQIPIPPAETAASQ
jgi:hypothetical protein